MSSMQRGAFLSKIARRWAKDIDQDYELVASILYGYARGDFTKNIEPALPQLLSGIDSPLLPALPKTETITLKNKDGQEYDTTISTNESPLDIYLIDNIEGILRENDPHIGYVNLRNFLLKQGVPAPAWLDPNAKPQAARKLSQNEIRKSGSQQNYDLWQLECQKLEEQYPDHTISWYARRIAKLAIANGRKSSTIRNHIRPSKK